MFILPNIRLFDVCLGVIYLFIIYLFAYYFKKKKQILNPEYKWFLEALSAKIIGAISFVLISMFYYKTGDTFLYFQIAESIRNHLSTNTKEVLRLLVTSYDDLNGLNFNPLKPYNYYYERGTTWFFSRIVFLFNTISFGSYLVSSLLISLVSFIGLWVGYSSLCRLYPKANKLMVVPFFLIPTALIWSSGLLKDTLIMGMIGLLLYAFIDSFILKKRLLLNIIIIILCFVLIQNLKPILLIVLVPCLLIWVIPYITKNINKSSLKIIAKSTIFFVVIGVGYFMNNQFVETSSKYKIENLFKTLQGFQSFHSLEVFSKGQNVYTLGGLTETPISIIQQIPAAVNVTFFRPYFWEVNNLPMLLGALESFLLFLLFIYVLIVIKKRSFKSLKNNNEIIFMITFSIIYSVVVGLSSYNFGALSRYKIPATFFFILSLIISYKISEKRFKIKF